MKPALVLSFSLFCGSVPFCDGLASEPDGEMHTIEIRSTVRKQRITEWGHDIKQLGKARSFTAEDARALFVDGKFTLLRIPIYANAHHPDGSLKSDYHVSMEDAASPDESMMWEMVPAEDDWFHLRNIKHDKHVRALPPGTGPLEQPNTLEIDSTSHTGHWTQWRMVKADGNSHFLENRGHRRYLRATPNGDLALVDKDTTGRWTQWDLIDAGEERVFLSRRGLGQYLRGGGSEYDIAMRAIRHAVENGRPDLFASHKIYDSGDHRTRRNVNFGPFYTSDGIDTAGFAACIDAFIGFVETETGHRVKYVAPRCELGNHWTPEAYVDVVNRLQNRPLIVGPEAASAVNAERFWTPEVADATDIRATHNKEGSPLWPTGARYNWDGETIGGHGENFIQLFFKLHEAFYKGEVTGIVFWGDAHLHSTNDEGRNGPFRRELVAASDFHLIDVDLSFTPDRSAIAFETEEEFTIRIFYSSIEPIRLRFDRPLLKESLPDGATGFSGQAFALPATGPRDYGSFTVSFAH